MVFHESTSLFYYLSMAKEEHGIEGVRYAVV